MFSLSIDGTLKASVQRLVDRDARIAITWALNNTVEAAKTAINGRMDQVFDRPTSFTKNAMMNWRATSATLEAAVMERPSVGRRHYLKVQEQLGPRGQTGLEQAMAMRLAYDGVLRAVIPGEHARLDAHGNWSSGERNQVTSALSVQRDPAANETKASRKRAKGRARYFVPKQGLAPGVYRRDTPDGLAFRVLKFTDKVPTYSNRRLSFYEDTAEVYRARLPEELRLAIQKMVIKRA